MKPKAINSMKAISDLIERARMRDGFRSNGPLTSSKVIEVQSLLDLDFPRNYSQFLMLFGSGKFGYFDFFGGIDTIPMNKMCDPNLFFYNKIFRENYNLRKPLVAIADAGSGDNFCINLEQSGDMGKVVVWNPSLSEEPIGQLECVADRFGEFLEKVINGEL